MSTNEEVSLNFLASGPEGRNHLNPPALLFLVVWCVLPSKWNKGREHGNGIGTMERNIREKRAAAAGSRDNAGSFDCLWDQRLLMSELAPEQRVTLPVTRGMVKFKTSGRSESKIFLKYQICS